MIDSVLAITFDIDWAPDFVIQEVADILRKNKVRATWFVTHKSPAIDGLRDNPELFELGIHPNFLPGSTHGSNINEVLKHCMALVPDAVSYRSHSIYHSGWLYEAILANTPIRVDSNTFLPAWSHIQPIKHVLSGRTLTRVPFFWIDDYEMSKKEPLWTCVSFEGQPGLQVFAFHPLHIYLNASSLNAYDELKRAVGVFSTGEEEAVQPFKQGGYGVRTMFEEVVQRTAIAGGGKLMKEFA